MGQQVDGGRVLGQPHRVVQWRQQQAGADLDPLGAGGDGRGHRHQRRHVAVIHEVVLGQPHRVEAQPLRLDRQLDRLAVEVGVAALVAGWPLAGDQSVAELHGAMLATIRSAVAYAPLMTLYRLADDPPTLVDPVMIACFDGWVDAAEAASSAVAHVAADAEPMVTFDPDAIFDYRSRRPVLDVQDGRLSDLRWPELAIRHVPVDGRDLLIFSGAEPDLRWQELASDVVALVASLGVALWVSLGAVPGAVAHTMPVPVMATASQDGLLGQRTPPGPEGLLRVPSAALSAMEMAVSGSGIPAIGFFAQVPPYASIGYTAASIALLERLGRHLEVDLQMDDLHEEEREQRARYDAAVAGDAMLRQTVEQLESAAGDMEEQQLPSGDELAREIERFLRHNEPDGEA